jgi:uncharacterized phage-associated protein
MKNINALALADYILGKYPGKNITPMKLQKLAYYSKVWTLVAGENMVAAEFEKWDFGPVNYLIFQKVKKFSKTVVPFEAELNSEIPPEQDELLTFILDNYVDFSAFALSAILP